MKANLVKTFFAVALVVFTTTKAHTDEVTKQSSGKVTGQVVDAKSKSPVEYATIAVYSTIDSTLVTGTITDMEGRFNLKDLKSGSYYIQVNFIGFEKSQSSAFTLRRGSNEINLGEIFIRESNVRLDEVEVTAERSRVEYKIDKRVVNVEKDISSKGGTAASVLENTPSVQVDPQGNVTLRGSSDFIVLIDGKPSSIKGSDALKQIPASAIKQIEVITNPSAKYEADGQAGIINVIMQKDKMQGLSGNLSLGAGNTHKRTGNALVNYRTGGFNLFGGVDYTDNIFGNTLIISSNAKVYSDTIHYIKVASQSFLNYNVNYKAGTDIELNENNSISLSGNVSQQSYDRGTFGTIYKHNLTNFRDDYSKSVNFTDIAGLVYGANAEYTHKFAENHNLSISGVYFSWNGEDDNKLNELITNDSYNEVGVASKLRNQKSDFNYNYRINIDYKQPIKKGNFEAGVQYRFEKRFEDFVFQNYMVSTDEWVQNPLYTYNLRYKNAIYSGYTTYSNTLWGIGCQLGLRSEYFDRGITTTNSIEPNNFSKFMFYPSLHLSKSIGDQQQVQLSYSRRINRPVPYLLNDIPQYIDPENVFMGNPQLKPEYTDSYEFNYRSSISIFTISSQTYFRNTTNIFQSLRLMGVNGVMTHQLANSKNQVAYGEEIGFDVKLAKWWQISTGANLYHYKLNTLVNSTEIKQEAFTWDARAIANFQLKWGTRIQAIGYYRAPNYDAMGKNSGFFVANLALNQPVLKGKGNLSLSAQNIFDSIKFNYSTSGSSFDNKYVIQVEGPVFIINFSYTFNNFQNKNRGRADDIDFKGGGAF
ncbi:MAG: TonB-dependent receptor [Bacteroidales bacterium]|nr:TonB-dependent receptor [Bacteroidales bacterium]